MNLMQELYEMTQFDSFDVWKEAMTKRGMTEMIQEDEFNKNHVYALNSTWLIGLWDVKKQKGLEYAGKKGKGMAFSKGYGKSKRKLKKLDMNTFIGK